MWSGEPAFCMTYGDGVSDVDIGALIAFHQAHGQQATVTAVTPPGRFGALARDGDAVNAFIEKPAGDGGTINGGFFVLSPKVLDRIAGDATTWEAEPLQSLAHAGELMAYDHEGLLAGDGHAARPGPAGTALGQWPGALEAVVNPAAGFWRGRRVLVTGHTGFKGAWLALLLHRLGAEVTGIALLPEPGPNAFDLLRVAPLLAADHRADIRDGAALAALVRAVRPEVVLHLAAQAFVGRGYAEPAATFATNVDRHDPCAGGAARPGRRRRGGDGHLRQGLPQRRRRPRLPRGRCTGRARSLQRVEGRGRDRGRILARLLRRHAAADRHGTRRQCHRRR